MLLEWTWWFRKYANSDSKAMYTPIKNKPVNVANVWPRLNRGFSNEYLEWKVCPEEKGLFLVHYFLYHVCRLSRHSASMLLQQKNGAAHSVFNEFSKNNVFAVEGVTCLYYLCCTWCVNWLSYHWKCGRHTQDGVNRGQKNTRQPATVLSVDTMTTPNQCGSWPRRHQRVVGNLTLLPKNSELLG